MSRESLSSIIFKKNAQNLAIADEEQVAEESAIILKTYFIRLFL